jgi:hypothetical protein
MQRYTIITAAGSNVFEDEKGNWVAYKDTILPDTPPSPSSSELAREVAAILDFIDENGTKTIIKKEQLREFINANRC